MFFGVVCISDRCSAGLCQDKSGQLIRNLVSELGKTAEYIVVPDEKAEIEKALIYLCDDVKVDVVFTTGGTGFSPRDTTPAATYAVATRLAPGIAEAIRAESLKITKHAMLSRGGSVIRGKTLIINLPGSPKACMESMDVFMDAIPHAMGLLRNEVQDCARK